MKVSELFKYVIERGMERDPRGKGDLAIYLEDAKKEHDNLDEGDRWEFDQERLWNPYDDSRVLNNPGDPVVKRVLMGINIDTAEIMVADRLNQNGEAVDMVIGHHPRGTAMPGLANVMNIQKEFYEDWGVPINVAEQLMEPRIAEVRRAIMPSNHQQAVDSARLLGMPFMVTHSPADIMVQDFMQRQMDERKPRTVGDIIKVLKEYPEYRTAIRLNNPPRVIIGKKENRAGRIAVKFAGGTGGAKTLYDAFETAGVGTVVMMHINEDHIDLAKEHNINVLVAGHMASDSMGMNLMYGELEKEGELDIIRFSGLINPEE